MTIDLGKLPQFLEDWQEKSPALLTGRGSGRMRGCPGNRDPGAENVPISDIAGPCSKRYVLVEATWTHSRRQKR